VFLGELHSSVEANVHGLDSGDYAAALKMYLMRRQRARKITRPYRPINAPARRLSEKFTGCVCTSRQAM
jgi:hypothetical protein